MTSVEEIIEISKNDYVNYDHREGKRKSISRSSPGRSLPNAANNGGSGQDNHLSW